MTQQEAFNRGFQKRAQELGLEKKALSVQRDEDPKVWAHRDWAYGIQDHVHPTKQTPGKPHKETPYQDYVRQYFKKTKKPLYFQERDDSIVKLTKLDLKHPLTKFIVDSCNGDKDGEFWSVTGINKDNEHKFKNITTI